MKVVKTDDSSVADVVVMNTNDLVYNNIKVSGSHEMFRPLNSAIVWDEEVLLTTGVYQTKYPIVVANTSDSIVALTEFKWAYAADPEPISTGLNLTVTSTTPMQALLATQGAVKEYNFVKAEDIEIIWSDTKLKEGQEATLVVNTPAKVEMITVGGVEITEFKLNSDGTKTWEYTFTVEEIGESTYEILLYDADGVTSDPIETETITVNEKTILDVIIEMIRKLIKLIWGIF